jgi:prepilin-type N-terminal cleavage/methylation domain-containing protein
MRTTRRRGFTLLELLITIGIVVMLSALLLPAIRGINRSGYQTRCLNNMRQLQLAHAAYMTDNHGYFVDVGLPHGGGGDEDVAWINTLEEYYGNELVVRSPLDRSPHWSVEDGGDGIPVNGRFRRTSYGGNNYLSRYASPFAYVDPDEATDRITKVPDHAATVNFLIMAFESDSGFAISDHVHADGWWVNPPVKAADEMQTNAVSGVVDRWEAVSNYSFLDGRVESLPFHDVYLPPVDWNDDGIVDEDDIVNRFNPRVSNAFAIQKTLRTQSQP